MLLRQSVKAQVKVIWPDRMFDRYFLCALLNYFTHILHVKFFAPLQTLTHTPA